MDEITAYHSNLIHYFRDYFRELGYIEEPSVKITQRIDETVLFVGSPISAFKKYLLTDSIFQGRFIVQDCLRTQNINAVYFNDIIKWSSFFTSLGLINTCSNAEVLCQHAIEFLLEVASIPRNKLVVRVYKNDTDLIDMCNSVKYGDLLRISDDYSPLFRHKYGIDGITGRNFNFAIVQKNGAMEDFGNFIVIEKGGIEKIAVEVAWGLSTLVSRFYGKTHSLEASIISRLMPLQTQEEIKFADTLYTLCVLVALGVRPSPKGQGAILKKYIDAFLWFRKKLYLQDSYLQSLIESIVDSFEGSDYDKHQDIMSLIADYEMGVKQKEQKSRMNAEKYLNKILKKLGKSTITELPGNYAFQVCSTFGISIALLREILRDQHNLEIDETGFIEAEVQHKKKS